MGGCGIRPWYPWRASVPIERESLGISARAARPTSATSPPSRPSTKENADLETIRVKRRLWYDLLRTALGEIAYSPEGMSDESRAALEKVGVGPEEMDDLFVRHTYLGAVIGMVVQASFGIDIRRLAATDPADLLQGRELYRATGLQGVLESDFFTWPNEVGGNPLLHTLARRVARFDWADAPPDTAATLYETIIRRTNGGSWVSTTPRHGWSAP